MPPSAAHTSIEHLNFVADGKFGGQAHHDVGNDLLIALDRFISHSPCFKSNACLLLLLKLDKSSKDILHHEHDLTLILGLK